MLLRITVERKRRGWRQQDLAFHADVPMAEVSRIESGRMKPYPKHAKQLAKVLKLRPEQLTEEVRET